MATASSLSMAPAPPTPRIGASGGKLGVDWLVVGGGQWDRCFKEKVFGGFPTAIVLETKTVHNFLRFFCHSTFDHSQVQGAEVACVSLTCLVHGFCDS